ncbi:MAG: gliding motility-associated C-terminal domain-containing protein [Saprospiraceae bacterium]|nr:gliding motility-associated C-terminal domain-containing protein [Saprospiraceae bacterium]MCF8249837.1 gliding motility-associated C-terminal domain-containing protein [Saprospiraceae bacterium]MCF8279493.1 gliding motility-associated C-terminal domain-containing protein [Bacteroidales bacterium]MCF8311729.1 gliding motility-associated C-terminal domain-containing protein [Saprospiraceae bacterium]MCF8440296.1 gliding motility-associated C-terminal domain-containing protein [Saprospiraceae 
MRIIPRLIFLIVFFFSAPAIWAQNCGCADAGNCPIQFPANTNTQVCYEFTDAFNNNLASPSQGVCGVYIKFRHGHIGDLELTLTSPAGQQVQLVGSNLNCNTFTPLATWDILFVPCAATCHPDTVGNCIYPCVFDGCPTTCPWGSGIYDGEYHPFSGCLENFNTGPVNGQWCLEIGNGAQFNGGTIFDFEIILCDQSGILCCDADAGNLPDPNVTACIGDPSLNLDLVPSYGALVPDPAEYGYTFTVFHNGLLHDLDTTDNFTSYPVGTYTVCGLSYLLADSASLPTVGTPMTPQSLDADLHGATPPFCGDIGLNCVVVNIGAPPPTTMLLDTICDGQTVVFDGQNIGSQGTYRDTLPSFFSCDSIVNLLLTVLPNVDTKLFETVCFGDTVWVGNMPFSTTDTFVVDLLTSFGCDSTVTLDLTVLPENTTTLNEIICEGETFAVGNTNYSNTGTYVQNLTSWLNCDSTVTLNLTVVQTSVSIAPPDTLTCQQTTVPLTSTATTSFGTLSYAWTTIGGTFSGPTNQPNATATAPGDYILTVTAAGCSSSDTVTVLQDAMMPNAIIVPSATTLTCTNSLILLNGNNSTPTSNFNWVWTALGGSPMANTNTLIVTVTQPDTYRLVITDVTNSCKDTATIVITQNIAPPVANAGQDLELSCTQPTVNLSGISSTPNGGISFTWSTSGTGNILPPTNTATVATDAQGTYQLVVESLANGCRDTDLVVVTVDTLTPNAQIALPQGDLLNCNIDTLTLDGSGSTGSQFVVYQWTGNIFNQQGTPIAHTSTPGVFTLKLTDTSNGCADSTSVTIGTDFTPPVADAGPDDSLSCSVISLQIGGSGTSTGPDFIYEWTTSPGGAFLDPTDQPNVSVNEPASYLLTVTDTTNGCTSSDFVNITQNQIPPVANAGPDYVLNCTDTSVVLDASNSTIVPFAKFAWLNSLGDTISKDVQVAVDYPDTFVFVINLAFCTSYDTVVVTEGTIAPVASAGPDQQLDCFTGQSILDGSGADVGVNFSHQWTALSGNILSGETTPTPTVDDPGEYVLQVTNTASGCVSFDTVLVTLDTVACTPIANAGADGLINCLTGSTVTLQASGTVGPNVAYNWTPLSGNILNQANPFSPMVTAGEFVFTVTNNAVGLSANDTVLVTADTLTPLVVLNSNILSLTCPEIASCYPLNATGTSVGPQFSYSWESGVTGNICTDPTLLNAEVQGPDVYTLNVTNTLNGCKADETVLVQLLDFQPIADAGANFQIPCGDTTTVLNGSGSSVDGTIYTYQWTSFGGNILANGQTLAPVVMPTNPSDTFTLIVTNNLNFCQDTDQVVVFAPVNCNPDCAASVVGSLDCVNSSVNLVSTGSSTGPLISYQWTTTGGSFCAPQDMPTTCADAPGIYQLTVIRTYLSGAFFSTDCQVQVLANDQAPAVNAGPDDDLNCVDQTLTLNGAGSATGAGITYQWTTATGNFCGSTNQITTCVNEPGTYNLLVFNTLTGCSAMDSVVIGLDTLHPIAEAGPPDMLTCNNNTVVLMGSSVPANVSYFWTTPNGDICAGENTPTPVVCDSGTYILTVTIVANGCTDSDATGVSIDPNLPNPNAGPDLSYTCTDTFFTLNASATGGTLLDYQWTATNGGCFIGPTDVLQPTVACPGTYTLTATDQLSGCSGVSEMQVFNATAPPNIMLGNAPHINCQTPVVTLNASGSLPAGQLSFSWSTPNGNIVSGQNTAIPQVDTAGTYIVLVTNQATNCTATASLTVTMDSNIPAVNAGIDSTLNCVRNNLKLSGLGSATGTGINYLWTTANGNIVDDPTILMPQINAPGSYVLTVSDVNNGCVVMDTVEVTMDTLPPVASVVAAQTPTVTCATPQVQLLGSGSSPQGQLNFLWATMDGHFVFGTTAQNATLDSAGTYLLTVTHQRNGCTDTAVITVLENLTLPPLGLGPVPMITCDSITARLSVLPGTPNYTYQWEGPGTIVGATTPMPTVNQPGVFSVTVTDPVNGCQHDSSLVVSQNTQKPVAEAASFGNLDCDNLTAVVSGAGSTATGVSYLWTTTSPGSILTPDALTATVDAAGWYFILVKRLDNGCSATDSTEVVATAQPIDNVLLTLEHPDCLDPDGYIFIDSVFGGLAPYFYSVDGDIFITYPQFSYLSEGQHTVVVKDENGCSWTDTVTLLGPENILVDLGPDVTIQQGENLVLEAQLSIPMSEVDTLWWSNLPDSIECPQCLEQTVAPTETTTYRINIIDTNGCAAMDAVMVVVTSEQPFYVPTAFSPNGDGTNDRFIFYAGPEVAKVRAFRIFDRWGNLVFFEKDFAPNAPKFGWDGRFEGQAMNPAVFVWQAEVEFVDGKAKVFYGEVTLVR